MAVKLRKPILVGGIGVSLALWLWNSLQQSVIQVGELSIVGAIALGTVFWFFQQKASKKIPFTQVSLPLNRETVEQAIAQAEAMITVLETEAADKDISSFKQQVAQLPELLMREELQLAVTGGKKVGKTTLRQVLENRDIVENICFVETEAFFTETDAAEEAAKEVALASDLILFLTAGDLTDSEWQTLQQLRASNQRLMLIFNKQDQYLPEERAVILQQLRQRVQEIIAVEDVVAISSSGRVKVRQHQEDGSVQEWMEKPRAEVGLLNDRLTEILSQERQQLVWATTWREAIGLKTKAKNILNEVRRDRALPVIEQYQWIAAAATFANPVAALDLLATAAINAQMLVDLSDIYQQKFSLSQAQTASGTIGKLMVKLGLVELSTQAIGGILKSNALTYVAGGAVQGISAAYLTRLAGLSLIEYFQEQEVGATSGEGLNLEKLGQKLQKVFEQNQRAAFLQSFIKQAVARLSPECLPRLVDVNVSETISS
ncbi:MAG: DUF697 domain-containing protein [Xenococcaceae cyanobacterium]